LPWPIRGNWQIVLIKKLDHLSTPSKEEKSSDKLTLSTQKVGGIIKQALRGLFVTGTSPDLNDRLGKRSDDEPGLKTQNSSGYCLVQPCGGKP
jgi:hypothetical protein